MSSFFRRVRRLLSAPEPVDVDGLFTDHRRRYEQTWVIIRAFYAMHFFWVHRALRNWSEWLEADHAIPIWPLSVFSQIPFPQLVTSVILLFTGSVVLAVVFPHRRLARAMLCAGWLLFGALDNSFGKIDHGFHAWIYVCLVLLLLPNQPPFRIRRSRIKIQEHLLVFATARACFLACYTISGFWKLRQGVLQWIDGEIGWLHPQAMSYLAANRLEQTASETILGPWVIESPLLSGLGTYAGLYVELFALLIVFRPRLLRWWGLSLIGLHSGAQLVMHIPFTSNVMLAGLILVAAPAGRGRASLMETIAQLPLICGTSRLVRMLATRFKSA